ncbi:hypothetical protein JCM17039_07700 [Blautia glucerasea]
MEFDLYEQGKELLKNDDNIEWIDKITCWVKKELGYNIYIFQVIVENQTEIEKYYETITASIAIDFQSNLEKAIEKWNIYLVFECKESIDWKIKLKVEQDKFAVRKIVWDDLKEEELNDKEYIRKRLLCFEINENLERHKDKGELIKWLEENDLELYKILQKKDSTLDQKVAMYVGDGINE